MQIIIVINANGVWQSSWHLDQRSANLIFILTAKRVECKYIIINTIKTIFCTLQTVAISRYYNNMRCIIVIIFNRIRPSYPSTIPPSQYTIHVDNNIIVLL